MKMLASFWLSRSKCFIELEKQRVVKHEQHRQLSLFLQPKGYGHGWLMPRLLEYMKCYPDITFDTLTERNLKDLADGKIEVLFAVHRFNRQGFVIKPYATLPCLAFASPSYIQQYGMLENPQDSALHVGLTRSGNNFPISKDLVTNGTDFAGSFLGKGN